MTGWSIYDVNNNQEEGYGWIWVENGVLKIDPDNWSNDQSTGNTYNFYIRYHISDQDNLYYELDSTSLTVEMIEHA